MVELRFPTVLARTVLVAGVCAAGCGLARADARAAARTIPCATNRAALDGEDRYQCELSAPARVQGHDFPAGAKLRFRPDGTLERARYESGHDFMVHGEEWIDTAAVSYDRSGAETGRTVEHWQSTIPEPVPGDPAQP